jgi:hypothetical protein
MTGTHLSATIRAKVQRALRGEALDVADRGALEDGMLPLFDDLAQRYYLREDGAVFRLDALEPEVGMQQVADDRERLAAYRLVVALYPDLTELIPNRPCGWIDCSQCEATGRAQVHSVGGAPVSTICLHCRGTGWLREA